MRGLLPLVFIAAAGIDLSGCTLASSRESNAGLTSHSTPATASDTNADPSPGNPRSEIEKWKACITPIHRQVGRDSLHMKDSLPRPSNTSQLLQNLKSIEDQDFVWQAEFFEGRILEQAFGDATTSPKPKPGYMNAKDAFLGANIHSVEFPGVVIDVESHCSVRTVKDANGIEQERSEGMGFIGLTISPVQRIALSEVRGIFGVEARQFIDRGVDDDGNTYISTEKGGVVYDRPFGGRFPDRKETIFYLQLGSSQTSDGDLIARITFKSSETNTAGNQ